MFLFRLSFLISTVFYSLSASGTEFETYTLCLEDKINAIIYDTTPMRNGTQYFIQASHPSGTISSTGNKIILYKRVIENGTTASLVALKELGSFTNRTDLYTMSYSSYDRPPNGYDKYAKYNETKYEGHNDNTYYIAPSLNGLIAEVSFDVQNTACRQHAANYAGNFNRDDNFWTLFCPKTALINELKEVSDPDLAEDPYDTIFNEQNYQECTNTANLSFNGVNELTSQP